MVKTSSSIRSLVILGLGLVLASVALSLDGRKDHRILVSDFVIEPGGHGTAEAAFLSSRQGRLLVLSTAGIGDEEALKLVSSRHNLLRATAEEGLVRVEIEPDLHPDGTDLSNAVGKILEQRLHQRNVENAERLQTSRSALLGRLEDLRKQAEDTSAQILNLIKEFPGEFNNQLIPTGATRARIEELSFRLSQLQAAAKLPAAGNHQDGPPEKTSALEKELEQLSETLGPFHPRMKALEKRLAALHATRIVQPVTPESVIAPLPVGAVSDVIRDELSRMRKRAEKLDAATSRIASLAAESIRLRAMIASVSDSLASLPQEPPKQRLSALGEHFRSEPAEGDVFPSRMMAFMSVLLGAMGAVLATGKTGETSASLQKPLPRILLDLSEEGKQ